MRTIVARTFFIAFVVGILFTTTAKANFQPEGSNISDAPVARGGDYSPPLQATPAPPVTPPVKYPTDEPSESSETDDTAPPDPGSTTSIVSRIFHVIQFPYKTLLEAVINSATELFKKLYNQLVGPRGQLNQVGNTVTSIVFNDTQKEIHKLRKDTWETVALITAVLLPFFFMMTVVAAMKDGVFSITGYQSAREATMGFFVSAGVAAASFLLINYSIEISTALGGAIAEKMGVSLSGDAVAGWMLKSIWLSLSTNVIVNLFLVVFGFIFISSAVISLFIALLASEVILFLLIALAPLAIMLGSMKLTRWVSYLWTKTFVIVLLLKPANVLLLASTGTFMSMAGRLSSGPVRTIVGILIAIGIVSVMISINTIVGKMVYGAAIEVAQKAFKTAEGVITLGATVAGFAIAGGTTGLVGMVGGSATATGIGGGGWGGSGGMPGIGEGELGGISGVSPSLSGGGGALLSGRRNYSGSQYSPKDVARDLGRALQMSRNPVARGLGEGLQLGAAADRMSANMQITQQSNQQSQMLGQSLSYYPGAESARSEIDSYLNSSAGKADKALVARQASVGMEIGKASMDAAQALGVPIPQYLNDLGYGGTVNQAGAGYLRSVAGHIATNGQSPFSSPYPIAEASPRSMGVNSAVKVMQGRLDGGAYSSSGQMANLAVLIEARHNQLGHPYSQIIKEAVEAKNMASWVAASYRSLPNRPNELNQQMFISPFIDKE